MCRHVLAAFRVALLLLPAGSIASQAVVGPNIKVHADPAPHFFQGETIIAVDPTDPNRLAITFKDDRPPLTSTLRCNSHAWSADGGLHWEDAKTELAPGFDQSWDPWMAWWRGGVLYDCSAQKGASGSRIFVHRSSDGGATFGSPLLVSTTGSIVDKPALAVDNNAGLGSYGTLYVTWSRVYAMTDVWASRSETGGTSWSKTQVSDPTTAESFRYGNEGAIPVVGPGGELYVAWMGMIDDDPMVLFDRSTDGGDTWSTDTAIPYLPWKNADHDPHGEPYLPSLAVDTSTSSFRGNLYMVWTAASSNDPGDDGDVFFCRSDNGGETWTSPVVINDDGTDRDQFFAHVAVDDAGGVVVSYASCEEDTLVPPNQTHHIFVRRSIDGGATFTPSVKITESPITSAAWSGGFSKAKNEYRNVVPNVNRYHAVWTDTRDGNPDVYTARFSFDLVPLVSTISAVAGGPLRLKLVPGPAHAAKQYALFLSFTPPTDEGTSVSGLHFDFTPDLWTYFVLRFYDQPSVFKGFIGTLDPNGAATAEMSVPAGFLHLLGSDKLFLVGWVVGSEGYATTTVAIDIQHSP